MRDWGTLAKEIADEVWKGHRRVDLTDAVEQLLTKKGLRLSDSELIARFDALKRSVSQAIQRRINESQHKGVTPKYLFAEIDPDILIPQIEKSWDEVRDDVANSIEQLGWRAFEHLSVHVLGLSGVTCCEAMRGTKEEGIDLFGVLDFGHVTGTSMWHGVRLRVLGQAKKGKVSEPTVRLFNQDKQSFLQNSGRAFQLAPAWFKRLSVPVVGFILTARTFTRPAAKWAAQHDIGAKDAGQITEDLLRTANTGRTPGLSTLDGIVRFDREEFSASFENTPVL